MLGARLNLKKPSYFFTSLLVICLGYLFFEYWYIPYSVLAVDEFVFARHIHDYISSLPYRDFPPYKGTLGYYLLSIPLFFSDGLLKPLFYIKDEIALINTACIMLAAYWATYFFDKRAILLAVLAIIANHYFLLYSADLRVDMLTSWFCLFSALSVLQNRLRLGGTLLGIAFLISQKAIWYLFAINGAMILCWIAFSSAPRYSWRSLFIFNTALIIPIIIYVTCWSLISSPSTVLYSLFYEAYIQASIDWYAKIYLLCWQLALIHGPVLFLLWPFTFLPLFEKKSTTTDLQRHLFIIGFASIALLFFVNYKQPFPYNFVFTAPAFFLLYANFFSWLRGKKAQITNEPTERLSLLFIFTISFYSFSIYALIVIFSLSPINLLIIAFPFIACALVYSWIKNEKAYSIISAVTLLIFIITSILNPLYLSWRASQRLSGNYQQTMIKLTDSLVGKDGKYLAGIPLLYTNDQPITGLKNLIGPALDYLYHPTEELKLLLLPSLYLTPTTPLQVLNDLEKEPIKVIITNYRILSLPPIILDYIYDNYQHFYGSVYLYAPKILSLQLSFYLKFAATYRLKTKAKARIFIDGKRIKNGQLIKLNKGDHVTNANRDYRLVLVPDAIDIPLDAKYREDKWEKMINPIIA